MARRQSECPGCGRRKSRRAKLCVLCRRTAIDVGVRAVLERKARSVEELPINNRQKSAFHGKCGELDRRRGLEPGETKTQALEKARELLGRDFASLTEWTYDEASLVLDWLEAEVRAARLAAV